MCFGPLASFTASAVLASVGTAVLRNIRSQKEILFAVFPAVFALQQLIEGILWLVLRDGTPDKMLQQGLTFAYLLFAYSLWPVLCPLSVYAIEYDKERRKILRALILMGVGTSLYLLFFILRDPHISASILGCSIRYQAYVAVAHGFTAVYIITVILPYFISSHRGILIFGIPNLIFCAIAYFFYRVNFTSVWCFFAALVSLSLYFFLRRLHHQPMLPVSLPLPLTHK